ncbi:hypothetical protein JGH11_09535 [Dysgonomonas sp. Marseille-P4677]|uniref:DUF6463 family protein n=1 Tax=Dysgonomonas sp. Marseille-P4677 TaxID=2364790 RepID=UPI00191239E5|nr:DUF6463 family protein [Dysgonomonas sp. Marseille-P4677]MBK5721108.1 hypothetical protein [Dysgonomonas sp. Marseille-P4677]
MNKTIFAKLQDILIITDILHTIVAILHKERAKPASLFLGYGLLVFSILGCLLEPVSGFWLFFQALIFIFSSKNSR